MVLLVLRPNGRYLDLFAVVDGATGHNLRLRLPRRGRPGRTLVGKMLTMLSERPICDEPDRDVFREWLRKEIEEVRGLVLKRLLSTWLALAKRLRHASRETWMKCFGPLGTSTI